MQEILAQQRNAARPVTGKGFIQGVAGVIIRLAIMQIVVNLLITATGLGLLNIAFYLYAIWLIVSFMGKTVAGSQYMLKENALYLQKTLGDSTTSVTEIPLEKIVSVRPVVHGERLESSYRHVTVVDAACAKPLRMRLAFALAMVSATLARKAAGKLAEKPRGYIVAFKEDSGRSACVFLPDEAFLAALDSALPGVCGADERTCENTPVTMMAQALERAFPELNAHVKPLVSKERVQQAKEEIAAQKQARTQKKNAHKPEGAQPEGQGETENTHEVQDDTL